MVFWKGLNPLLRQSYRCYSDAVRVRFAPSPTGQLHLGGLRTALYNFLFARSHQGKFILRAEDTDQTRLVPGALEKMIGMLEWAGIEIDEGPFHGGNYGPYIQSQRLAIYQEHIQTLLQNGSAYRCFCSTKRLELLRKEAQRRGEMPKYDNRCRHLTPHEVDAKLKDNVPYTIRFELQPFPDAWHDLVYGDITYDVAQNEGDPILVKSDRFPTYHFANVVDDHLMNVTHVLRGVEWQVSTPKHLLLYRAFGWKPPKYAHLPIILNKDGNKLSKRHHDIHVEFIKNEGNNPEAVLNLLTSIGSGFKVRSTVGFPLQELINTFDLELIRTNSSRLDMERLPEYNRLHLKKRLVDDSGRAQMIQEVRQLIQEQLRQRPGDVQQATLDDQYIENILYWAQDRIYTLQDLVQPGLLFLWTVPGRSITNDLSAPGEQGVKDVLQVTVDNLTTMSSDITQDDLAKCLKDLGKTQGFKYGPYMKLLRISLSGLKEGPPVAEIMSILGVHTSIQRLKQTVDNLS